MSEIKNTADFRKMLLDVITDVRNGKIEASDAKAIGSLASQILTSAKLDLDVMKASQDSGGRDISSTLLTYNDGITKSPYKGLPNEQYLQILSMKTDGKTLAVTCEKMKDIDKKLIAAAFYNKPIEEN